MEEAGIRAEIMSLPTDDPHEVLKKHLKHASTEGRGNSIVLLTPFLLFIQ